MPSRFGLASLRRPISGRLAITSPKKTKKAPPAKAMILSSLIPTSNPANLAVGRWPHPGIGIPAKAIPAVIGRNNAKIPLTARSATVGRLAVRNGRLRCAYPFLRPCPSQSQHAAGVLRSNGFEVTYVEIPGARHGDLLFHDITKDWATFPPSHAPGRATVKAILDAIRAAR